MLVAAPGLPPPPPRAHQAPQHRAGCGATFCGSPRNHNREGSRFHLSISPQSPPKQPVIGVPHWPCLSVLGTPTPCFPSAPYIPIFSHLFGFSPPLSRAVQGDSVSLTSYYQEINFSLLLPPIKLFQGGVLTFLKQDVQPDCFPKPKSSLPR